MKIDEYLILIFIFAIACCCIGLCSAANPTDKIHTNEASPDIMGKITVHVYEHYNTTTHKFEKPVQGATCVLNDWKSGWYVDSKTTLKDGSCLLQGKCLKPFHLTVIYPDKSMVNCDIHWDKDNIRVSPEHCDCKTG